MRLKSRNTCFELCKCHLTSSCKIRKKLVRQQTFERGLKEHSERKIWCSGQHCLLYKSYFTSERRIVWSCNSLFQNYYRISQSCNKVNSVLFIYRITDGENRQCGRIVEPVSYVIECYLGGSSLLTVRAAAQGNCADLAALFSWVPKWALSAIL